MNEKLRAALLGLKSWPNLQIVLTKNPVDSNGKSLVPEGVEIKVVRYFPLAELLSAFDGAIAATGYNSVHELLPARIPTVFISNIRGTDDQDARAQWCHDFGYALRANHADLEDITATVAKLCDPSIRAALSTKCIELKNTDGGAEIAQLLLKLANNQELPQEGRAKSSLRLLVVKGLRVATILYRTVRPQSFATNVSSEEPLFSDQVDATFLREAIKGNRRFEQMIPGASKEYIKKRQVIASRVYR
jgi:hypothetical protein